LKRRIDCWRGVPGQNYRRKLVVVLLITVPLLVWRLLDLLEELINGPIKMSLDRHVLTGPLAAALQVLIITALLLVTFVAANVIASPTREKPLR
jgi:hypothetical protein